MKTIKHLASIALAIGLFALAGMEALAADGAWTHRQTHDDFEDATRDVASSTVRGSPYRSATATVRCEQQGEERDLDVYFAFDYFNHPGGEPFALRLKFGDDAPVNWRVDGMSRDSSAVFMEDPLQLARNLADGTPFAMRVTYYKAGTVTLRFPGDGASSAIGAVLASECGTAVVREIEGDQAAKASWKVAFPACNGFIPSPAERSDSVDVQAAVESWRSCMTEQGAMPCYDVCGAYAATPSSPRGFARLYACESECAGH